MISQKIIKKTILNTPPMGKGITNDVYLLKIRNNKYILRIQNSHPRSLLRIKRHELALELLTSSNFTQKVLQIGQINKKRYFITNWIEGIRLSSKVGNEQKYIENIITVINQIHQYKFLGAGFLSTDKSRGSFRDWDSFIKSIISQVRQIAPSIIRDNIDSIEKQSKSLNKILNLETKSLLHLDLNQENILLGKNGSIFLIDWENAGVGDPLADFAILDNFWGKDLSITKHLNLDKTGLDRFKFYKKLFSLLIIYYKLRHNIDISVDIRRIKKLK